MLGEQSSDAMVGQRIRQARKEQGLNQIQLSRKLGIHRNSLVRYERGERSLDVELLARIASALEVSPHWLVTGEGSMRASPRVPESEKLPVRWIPVLGHVPAGFPRFTSEVVLEYLPVPEPTARHPQTFALIVRGDSMNPRLAEGDRVIVCPDPSPPNRALVVALVEGETTIKEMRVVHQDKKTLHVLAPSNPEYPPHVMGEGDRIVGRVVAVQKMLE